MVEGGIRERCKVVMIFELNLENLALENRKKRIKELQVELIMWAKGTEVINPCKED